MRPNAYFKLLIRGVRTWLRHDAFHHAGALAFYTLFSLAPLMIILVAIVGVVYGEEAARGEISDGIRRFIGQQAAAAVEDAVQRSRPQRAGIMPTLAGIGAVLFGATTVFAQMQSSLNKLWGVQAKPDRSGLLVFAKARLLSLGMVLIMGFLLLLSFSMSVAISVTLQHARHWMPVPSVLAGALDVALSLAVTTTLLGLLFKVLPDVLLRWRDVWRGALVTAVLFTLGQYLISYYLTRIAPTSAFGAAGSLILVLFWVYYSSLILFFGTALTKVAILHRDGTVTPKPTAVRVKTIIEEA